ncbi:YpmS family protein [Bacillus sp. B-jedd]|uniref:YpmS family protein n=1 Tax=Bacillus sp. B-jedd TaxID=1476857 RepID=UPI00051561DD|nr:YpmS family protein [Bacillus sp. B-jedd]CEG27541.1 YpmS [Bacillus sp. B-jedd]
MKNRWKAAFFILLGVVVAALATLIILAAIPPDGSKQKRIGVKEDGRVAFNIRTNKDDVNKLVNYYLEKEVSENPVNYRVEVKDEVELYGTVPFFSQELNMKLTFVPEAQKNGDLLLRQKSISVGQLHLPVPYVLDFIRKNYELPRGVEILPDERQIYIHMDKLKLKSDAKLKANSFDLEKDNISFTLLVPVK